MARVCLEWYRSNAGGHILRTIRSQSLQKQICLARWFETIYPDTLEVLLSKTASGSASGDSGLMHWATGKAVRAGQGSFSMAPSLMVGLEGPCAVRSMSHRARSWRGRPRLLGGFSARFTSSGSSHPERAGLYGFFRSVS